MGIWKVMGSTAHYKLCVEMGCWIHNVKTGWHPTLLHANTYWFKHWVLFLACVVHYHQCKSFIIHYHWLTIQNGGPIQYGRQKLHIFPMEIMSTYFRFFSNIEFAPDYPEHQFSYRRYTYLLKNVKYSWVFWKQWAEHKLSLLALCKNRKWTT